MKIINKVLYGVFVFFAVFCFLFYILVYDRMPGNFSFDDRQVYNYGADWIWEYGGEETMVSLPVRLMVPKGEPLILKKQLPLSLISMNALQVNGLRQDLEIYIDGVLRESFSDAEQRGIGDSSPDATLFVNLYKEDEGKLLMIKATTVTSRSGQFENVLIGNKASMILKMIKTNLSGYLIAFLIAILGGVFLICDIIIRVVLNQKSVLIHLFWFSLLVANWACTQSKMRQVFISNLSLFVNMGYACLMLLPIPVFFIMNGLQKYRHNTVYMTMTAVAIGNYIFQNIGQIVIDGADFYSMKIITQFEIIVYVFVIFLLFCIDIAKEKWNEIKVPFIGFIGLGAGTLSENLNSFFGGKFETGNYIMLGMLFFAAVNGVSNAVHVMGEEHEKEKALSASKAKSNFLATMSHEIRTPINAVLGMNSMIIRDSREPEIKEYARNIATAGKSLLALVNDILDFSKIESGKMEIVEADYSLKASVRDVVNMVQDRARQKDLAIEVFVDASLPSIIYGDEVRLRQVIINLMTNAIKYTNEGKVIFAVTGERLSDDLVRFHVSVKDSGIGIKQEDLEKLTQSFVRLDLQRNRTIEGTGLGLSITTQLLGLMDSELLVNSVYGKGSDFHFYIDQKIVNDSPVGDVSVADEPEEEEESGKKQLRIPEGHILVVDDNPMNLSVVKGLLKPTGVNVMLADSGKNALELCENNYFDLILMDHMMPHMDGIETLERLREMHSSPSCGSRVIALTANAIAGAKEMYLEKGFDDYLTKPIDQELLFEEIANCMPKEIVFYEDADKIGSPAETEQVPLNNEFIDGTLAMSYCGGDFDNYIEVLVSYYRHGKKSRGSSEYDVIFGTETINDFEIKIHALKSSSLTVGAKDLSEQAKALEMAAKNGDEQYIRENQEACRDAYEKVLFAAGEYLEKNGYLQEKTAAAEGDYGKALALVQQAREALDDFEYDEAMELLDQIISGN